MLRKSVSMLCSEAAFSEDHNDDSIARNCIITEVFPILRSLMFLALGRSSIKPLSVFCGKLSREGSGTFSKRLMRSVESLRSQLALWRHALEQCPLVLSACSGAMSSGNFG